MNEKVEFQYYDKENNLIGKNWMYILEHQFIPKTKRYCSLKFKFSCASYQKDSDGKLILIVIYREK